MAIGESQASLRQDVRPFFKARYFAGTTEQDLAKITCTIYYRSCCLHPRFRGLQEPSARKWCALSLSPRNMATCGGASTICDRDGTFYSPPLGRRVILGGRRSLGPGRVSKCHRRNVSTNCAVLFVSKADDG